MKSSVVRTRNTQKNVALESELLGPRVWRLFSLLVFAAISFVLLFWRLEAESLNDWDEAIYAQVAKEIVNTGDWLTLHWGYELWFHKPPLFMWVTATFFKLFEVNEFWARMPSALAGFGLVGVTYLIAHKLYENRDVDSLKRAQSAHDIGLLSVAVLLTNYTFVHFSRFGTTDIALTLFSYLAIYAYLWVCEAQRWAWCGVWSAIAVAVMIKGVAGVAIAIALFMTLLLTNRWLQALCCAPFWVGIGIAGLIIVPWHAAMLSIHGQAFVDQYFLYHVVERSTSGGLEGNTGGPFFYVASLRENFFPWVYLLPLALFWPVRSLWQDSVTGLKGSTGSKGAILLVLVAITLGGFSLAGTKLHWYIIPIYPALAIWVGALLHQALTSENRLVSRWLLLSSGVVMVLFSTKIAFLSEALQQVLAVVGVVVLLLLSLAAFMLSWHRQVLPIVLCSLFLIAGMREIKGQYYGYERPVAVLSRVAGVPAGVGAAEEKPPALMVSTLSAGLYRPAVLFYSNRPIALVRSPQEIAATVDATVDATAGATVDAMQKRDIMLTHADIPLLQNQYDIDVYAREGGLTYAGIKKRG